MQEQTLRDVLHTAATGAALPQRFLRPSLVVAAVRPATRWRRPALVAAASLLICTLVMLAMPGPRAVAEQLVKGVVTMWSGKVAGTDAQVVWTSPEAQKEMRTNGQMRDMPAPVSYRTVAAAAAAMGIRPAETHYTGAELSEVRVQVADLKEDARFSVAYADYWVGRSLVTISTEANLARADGGWKVLPYTMLVTGDGQFDPMENIRTVKLGSVEAIAYEQQVAGARDTWISWLQDGVIVRVSGYDPVLTEAVAAATVKN